MVEVLLCFWLGSTMLSFICYIIETITELTRSKAIKLSGIASALILLSVIVSGLSMALMITIAFANQGYVIFIMNGTPVGFTWYSIFLGLIFGCGAASATYYGCSFLVKGVFHVVRWIINKNYRKEHKIKAIEWALFSGMAVGVILMVILLISGEYELTLTSMFLCAYTPIIGAIIAMGFAGPIILVVWAYSGKRVNGKWVKK